MSTFDELYKLIMEQVQETDEVKEMHQLFLKAYNDDSKSEPKWKKNLKNNKISIYNTQKKKVLVVKAQKFESDPERYIDYAKKFISTEQDQQIDEKEVDTKTKQVKQEVKQIKDQVKSGDLKPAQAKKKLNLVWKEYKKEVSKPNPEIKKELTSAVKQVSTPKTSNITIEETTNIVKAIAEDLKQKKGTFRETLTNIDNEYKSDANIFPTMHHIYVYYTDLLDNPNKNTDFAREFLVKKYPSRMLSFRNSEYGRIVIDELLKVTKSTSSSSSSSYSQTSEQTDDGSTKTKKVTRSGNGNIVANVLVKEDGESQEDYKKRYEMMKQHKPDLLSDLDPENHKQVEMMQAFKKKMSK